MRPEGATRTEPTGQFKGILVVAAVLAIAFGILYTFHRYALQDNAEAVDITRMRAVYSALYLYEANDNDVPPPNLDLVRRDLGDDKLLTAVNDPFVGPPGQTYPKDPAFPNLGKSPVRISFTYLPTWVREGKVKVKNWQKDLDNVKVGILACYWYGQIDRTNPDGRLCDGPVVRINMDGSAYTLTHRQNTQTLTAEDLFFRR
jgi:hypothetical protein